MIYSRSKNRFCTVKNIYEPTQTGMLVVNMLIDRFRFVLKGRLCYKETLYKTPCSSRILFVDSVHLLVYEYQN